MTATATERPAQAALIDVDPVLTLTTVPRNKMIEGHHQAMLERIEDFVFFVTVCGMSHLDAAARLGVTEHTMDRWLHYIAAHRELGRWHAAPSASTCRRRGTTVLPHVLDCPRNHNTTGKR